MHPRLTRTPLAAAATVLLAAAGCGSSTPSAQRERPGAAVEDVPAAAVEHLALDRSKLERRGTFQLPGQRRRSIYVAPRKSGAACVLDVDSASVGAGCSPILFAEHEVAFVEGSNGGPDAATMTDLHVAGVASARVRSLQLELTSGIRTDVPLTDGNAFLYEAALSDLHAGVLPKAIHAFDAAGRKIDTMPLPAAPAEP